MPIVLVMVNVYEESRQLGRSKCSRSDPSLRASELECLI